MSLELSRGPARTEAEKDQIIRDLTQLLIRARRHLPPEESRQIEDYFDRRKLRPSPFRSARHDGQKASGSVFRPHPERVEIAMSAESVPEPGW